MSKKESSISNSYLLILRQEWKFQNDVWNVGKKLTRHQNEVMVLLVFIVKFELISLVVLSFTMLALNPQMASQMMKNLGFL